MIELQHITKIYNTKAGQITALDNISLQIKRGEIFGVIGKSGAGKSTLIRCVNLLERPSSGVVQVADQNMMMLSPQALRRARHNIGMVFQHFNLLTSRTVYQNIAFPLELIGQDKNKIEKTVQPLLELIGLKDRRDAYPSQLSGGQKQRVAIARALATKPKVLLCDEMTSALDPTTTDSILRLVKSINEEFQLTIFLITHEMDVIKKIANQVAVLEHGRMIEQADVLTLFKNPKQATTQAFVHSSLKAELPRELAEHLQQTPIENGQLLLRLAFIGKSAAEPVVEETIKRFKVDVNILQANLEFLRHETIGMMIMSVAGADAEIQVMINYLKEKGLGVEVLGYVRIDDLVVR